MTKLHQHIDDLRARLTQTAANEQSLVKRLSDALGQIDRQLVQDIRKVTSEHESRRAGIFSELQALACSIGVFQPAQELPPQNDEHSYFPAVGDWRQATMNLNYQDEVEHHANGTGPQY